MLNPSELGRALGTSHTSIRRYLEFLANAFVIRVLQPWSANLAKRQIKHPKVFLLDQVIRLRGTRRDHCFFWGTHGGAELDLLVVEGNRRIGSEFKRTVAPSVTPSMKAAIADLGLNRLDVIHGGPDTFPLAKGIRAVSADRLVADL